MPPKEKAQAWKICSGPEIEAGAKCLSPKADSCGGHMTAGKGDTAPYNGVRTWRCPECFESHRLKVREQNK